MKPLFVALTFIACTTSVSAQAQPFPSIDANQIQNAIQSTMMQSMFSQIDMNADGKVSRDEAISQAAKRFDMSDTNKDGFMTKEEMRMAHQQHKDMRQQGKGTRQPQDLGMPQQQNNRGVSILPTVPENMGGGMRQPYNQQQMQQPYNNQQPYNQQRMQQPYNNQQQMQQPPVIQHNNTALPPIYNQDSSGSSTSVGTSPTPY